MFAAALRALREQPDLNGIHSVEEAYAQIVSDPGVVFDLNKICGDEYGVQDGSHEYGDDEVNATLVIGANNGSAAAKEAPKIFAIHHFDFVHLNEMVEIDVGSPNARARVVVGRCPAEQEVGVCPLTKGRRLGGTRASINSLTVTMRP